MSSPAIVLTFGQERCRCAMARGWHWLLFSCRVGGLPPRAALSNSPVPLAGCAAADGAADPDGWCASGEAGAGRSPDADEHYRRRPSRSINER